MLVAYLMKQKIDQLTNNWNELEQHILDYLNEWQDSDDEWVADKLEKQLAQMQQKGTKVVYCRFSRVYENDNDNEKISIVPHMERKENLEGDLFYELLSYQVLPMHFLP